MSSGPIDVRLLRVSPAAAKYVLGTGIAQAADTSLIVLRGFLLGGLAAGAITKFPMFHVKPWVIAGLVAVVCAQAAVSWLRTVWASKSAGNAIHQLRKAAMRALARRDPREVSADSARWTLTLGRELEGLRTYLAEYVPALVAVCLSTPTALAVIFYLDRPAGWLALCTVPLIPLFMVLIGRLTRGHTKARLRVASALQHRLADILGGATTLRRYGREEAPRRELEQAGRRHATTTMGVLRLAFLSSFALELLATLSVALVAVSVGLRLVTGSIELRPALIVLIIVPEVYAPLRAVGASFHAAADGMAAASAAVELCSAPGAVGGYRSLGTEVRCERLTVHGREGDTPRGLTFEAAPGTITVLRGANGSGKSTALLAIAGLLPDDSVEGQVTAPADLAYLPAAPAYVKGTVGDNARLMGSPWEGTRAAMGQLGLEESEADPFELSTGQAHRVAIARTLAHPHASTLLLDEPSAHLSPEILPALCALLRRLAGEGACVVVASHDPRLASIADQVIEL
ncbi:ABC transporter transmembrane domain-containing protein [Corynebacterium vitaeruminis]|uniref:ABC transporter transmembrane domain-containing protein n=1 Tax=Corynebacterium vitaeruminis TaxID=38305 RepID=UPI0023F32C6B|nr:ABC transporter transmembrane domain-containing protein [Corynebacterium vitaeruminis]